MTGAPGRVDPVDGDAPDVDGDGVFAPHRRALTVGLVLTVTLVAFESLAVATVMPEVKDDLGGLALYGWVFSGFFLASLAGIVISGQVADRRGMTQPYLIGLAAFAVGLLIGAEARSMPMLIVGRLLQGFGAGAIPAIGYTAIGRGLPAKLRPRMFAVLSTAWVLPGLVGPAIATGIEHALSWRWVFGGLVPLVLVAGVMTAPALRSLDRSLGSGTDGSPGAIDRRQLLMVAALVVGVGAVFAAMDVPVPLAVVLLVVGIPLAGWTFTSLTPSGTVRLAPGVPATVAVRGLLTWAFFGGDAYVPLAITDGRGEPAWVGGTALTAGAVCWTAGSWLAARVLERFGPRRLVGLGTAWFTLGALVLVVSMRGLPVAVSVLAWGLAAFGMGMAYSPLSVTVLGAAAPGEEGAASAALQLSDTLGISIGTGIGGALIAFGDGRHWSVASSTTWVFVLATAMGVAVHLASRRLPVAVPTN